MPLVGVSAYLIHVYNVEPSSPAGPGTPCSPRAPWQVDFRVDDLQLPGGFKAQLRKQRIDRLAVCVHAAEHHALAVVALLDARIQVAVPVKGEENFFEKLQRGVAIEKTGFAVRLKICLLYTSPSTAFARTALPKRNQHPVHKRISA